MYKYKPERNVKQVFLLMASCIIGLVAIFALSIYWESQSGILRFIGFLFAALAMYVVIRFTMTEMEYAVEGNTFVITKIVGNKRTVQGALDLADTIALVNKAGYRANGYNKNYNAFCNYSQNIGGKHWYYVCEFSGKRAVIEFEPSDTFVAIMRDAINKSQNEPKDSRDFDADGGILI